MLTRIVETGPHRFRTIAMLIGLFASVVGFWSGVAFEDRNHRRVVVRDGMSTGTGARSTVGDITTLTSGTGLSGGMTSGAAVVNADASSTVTVTNLGALGAW